ncbi:MAG: hypothetical protein LBJ00_15865 [Planctomycetaceae bacterium]|nr:hypothetical protein [Planctomycetaceae bacterium]
MPNIPKLCFKISETGHTFATTRDYCSRAKPTTCTGFGVYSSYFKIPKLNTQA